MPHGARVYGLTVDRWIDERLDPERSTLAAARYLADLHKRFGGWELAFAAYNMGYGGLLASIRKYNTNDFWELSRLEAGMPLETALYVPKIVAMAIVARNKEVFGVANVELDAAVSFDKVSVGSGISLKTVAAAAGAPVDELRALNPQLLASRTPPGALDLTARPSGLDAKWVLRVPAGSAAAAAKSIPKLLEGEARLERYLVRWGESLEAIATFRGTTRSALQSLNDLRPGEVIRPGTVIFVPAAPGVGAAAAANLIAESPAVRPVVVTPAQTFVYPNRRRVFYRVVAGDTLRDLGAVLGVTADELSRWNMLDPGASLHEGMTLQAYIPKAHSLARAFVLEEKDARVIAVGSPEFFDHFEGLKGRKRVEIAARDGDTFQGIAKRFGLTMGMLERINHRSRSTKVLPGDRLVVYVPNTRSPAAAPDSGDVDNNNNNNNNNTTKPSERPETAVASADAGGDDAPEVKPAVLRMTPDEAEDDGDEGGGDGAAKAAPERSKEPGSTGRSKATLAPARP
jgi:membrane-bound lytic murein transglycosylase D